MDRKAEIERAANIVTTARGISRHDAIRVATIAITPLLDRCEQLEAALRPFTVDQVVTNAHFRAAKAALKLADGERA